MFDIYFFVCYTNVFEFKSVLNYEAARPPNQTKCPAGSKPNLSDSLLLLLLNLFPSTKCFVSHDICGNTLKGEKAGNNGAGRGF